MMDDGYSTPYLYGSVVQNFSGVWRAQYHEWTYHIIRGDVRATNWRLRWLDSRTEFCDEYQHCCNGVELWRSSSCLQGCWWTSWTGPRCRIGILTQTCSWEVVCLGPRQTTSTRIPIYSPNPPPWYATAIFCTALWLIHSAVPHLAQSPLYCWYSCTFNDIQYLYYTLMFPVQ